MEALSAEGNEKIILSRKITYPIVNILMNLILTDEKFEVLCYFIFILINLPPVSCRKIDFFFFQNRYYFCDCSLTKLKWDENSIGEMIRVLMTGEKPSTKVRTFFSLLIRCMLSFSLSEI